MENTTASVGVDETVGTPEAVSTPDAVMASLLFLILHAFKQLNSALGAKVQKLSRRIDRLPRRGGKVQ